jgi:deoxycytidylate deaminase
LLADTATLNNIDNELIIGLAGGLGTDFDAVAAKIAYFLSKAGYHIEIIRIAANFVQREDSSKFAQCYWKMQYGTKQRQINGNDYWAKKVIRQIFYLRPELSQRHKKIAYIVRSLKNKEELELLSNVYGRNFIAVSVFSEKEESLKFLDKKLKLGRTSIHEAQQHMLAINTELQLGSDMDINEAEELYLDDAYDFAKASDQEKLVRFLVRKDQEETHPELKKYGQNLFKCYSIANFFVYQNTHLERQIQRFTNLLFNYPFAEPTHEEYFMFCAQAAAYRSLDLDRQVGAVIVNAEQELVATGFNDVSKVGGGHFQHHDHPLYPENGSLVDKRDFKQEFDYNHIYLDRIAHKIAQKLHLAKKDQQLLREEISGVTEFKRSTHAEMSALLDASRRGVPVRDCTIYVNTYPCHNCTKHIIASGIKKVIFLHPYTKSKSREMYNGMIKHGLFTKAADQKDVVTFEPFLGVSPNRFFLTFANDKDTRLEQINGKETGKIVHWSINENSIPRELSERQPHSYISREWAVIHNKLPDMSVFYK